MVFNCFTVRDYADRDGDPMYPLADEAARSILLAPDDGPSVMRAVATGFAVAHQGDTKRHPQVRLDQIKAEILVTDTRVAVAVPKYDKGGGWFGGAGALAMNAVSKARGHPQPR